MTKRRTFVFLLANIMYTCTHTVTMHYTYLDVCVSLICAYIISFAYIISYEKKVFVFTKQVMPMKTMLNTL